MEQKVFLLRKTSREEKSVYKLTKGRARIYTFSKKALMDRECTNRHQRNWNYH